jgi:hypothetical protein
MAMFREVCNTEHVAHKPTLKSFRTEFPGAA